jgi:hypothetical protein
MQTKQQVILPQEVVVKAEARARALGLTLAEYVKALVDEDVATKERDPWLEPVLNEVDDEWEQDIATFDEQEKTTPHSTAKTVNEFRRLLTQEVESLPEDEGN